MKHDPLRPLRRVHGWIRKDGRRKAQDLYRRIEGHILPSISYPDRRWRGVGSIASVPGESEALALTFDDGPDPEHTPVLLDLLAKHGVRATFYLIGRAVADHPELAARITAEGHEVGNHTWSHRALVNQTIRSCQTELAKAHQAITDAAGVQPATMRPPFGYVTPSLTRWMEYEFGYPTVQWSLDSRDWEEPEPNLIVERLQGATAGDIVLNHDPEANTVAAMPDLLTLYMAKGLEFVTVSELLASAR